MSLGRSGGRGSWVSLSWSRLGLCLGDGADGGCVVDSGCLLADWAISHGCWARSDGVLLGDLDGGGGHLWSL